MAQTDITSTETTDMANQITNYSVAYGDDTGDKEIMIDWTKWLGFYQQVPELQSVIDKKAMWTVGKGFQADASTTKLLKAIRGDGKDTFNLLMDNAVKTYTICGDAFFEIIRMNGRLKNLKRLNPGTIKVIANKRGFIKRYEQWDLLNNKKLVDFEPEEIFHLSWNRKGDNHTGTGTVEKLSLDKENRPGIIEMLNEAKQDLKTVYHRYVKPLIVSYVDTDDEAEITAFKNKLDNSVKNGENLIVPKETVDSMERVSIPQYSTLDPMPWIKFLERMFIKAEGVPGVILGDGDGTTEATSKIVYLAFQQVIEFNQQFLEEQIEAQLGLQVEFNFPASLEMAMQEDVRKERSMNNYEMNPNQAVR